jgi:HPt (histidine-containing phosphotransfer) domain-containing protein
LAQALARADGSEKLLHRVWQVFLDNLPRMWAAIQTAVASREASAIQHAAHTLKGSAGLIGAQAVTEAARALEMMAKSGKMDGLGTGAGNSGSRIEAAYCGSRRVPLLPVIGPSRSMQFSTHAAGSLPTYRQLPDSFPFLGKLAS